VEDLGLLKQSIWKKEWKRVIQIAERKSEKVNGNEVAHSVQAGECEGNQNSDFNEILDKVTESETHAEDQTEQSWTRGASSVQRALTTDSTAERVQEAQVYESDENEGLYIKWLEIMFEISAKKSNAEMKKKEIQKQKRINEMLGTVAKIKKKKTQIRITENMRKILENLTHDWDAIFEKVTEVQEEVSEKSLVAKCEGGNMTSEWSEVLENVGNIEKKLKKKREEEANSEHTEKDQTSDWDEIFDKGGDILYLLEAAGKIERATAIQLAMAARDKHKKALFG